MIFLLIICIFLCGWLYVLVKGLDLPTYEKTNSQKHSPAPKQAVTRYEYLLHQPEWYDFRKKILKLRGNTCEWCGSRWNLQIHHKVYYRSALTHELVMPWNYPEDKVMCLCGDCHKKYHNRYKVKVFEKRL